MKQKKSNDISFQPVSLIELEISKELSDVGDDIENGIFNLRQDITDKFGFIPPLIPVRLESKLKKGVYQIKLEDLVIFKSFVIHDLFFALKHKTSSESLTGIEGITSSGRTGTWIQSKNKEKAIRERYLVYSPLEIILENLRTILLKNVHLLIGMEETSFLIDTIRKTHGILINELIPSVFTILEIRRVLKRLLEEKVSLRPVINILQTLGDYSCLTKDSDRLTEYVRQSLGNYICKDYKDINGVINVIISDSRMERIFLKGVIRTEQGLIIELDPEVRRKLRGALEEHINHMHSLGLIPVILCSPEVRLPLRRFSEKSFPDLAILSLDEIPPDVKTATCGILAIEDALAYIESGDNYYRENKMELAEAEYKRAVEIDPANARAHYALRLTYRKMGKLDMALKEYQKAMELDSKYEFIDPVIDEEKEETEIKVFEKIQNTDEKFQNTESITDEIQLVQTRKQQEIPIKIEETVYVDHERIEKMKLLNPSFASIFNKMGEDYLKQKNYESALKEFEKSIELDSKYAIPYKNTGIIYFNQGDWYKCRKELEKAIELDPDFQEAYLYLGKLFKVRNMKDKAEQAFYMAWDLATKQNNKDARELIKKELEELNSQI
jgi:tetratricopeptide (TPR) repeat protein